MAIVVVILGGSGSNPCPAHPANIAAATAKVQPDGHFQVQVRFDLLAFALDDTPARIGDPPMNQLLDGPEDALRSQLAEAAGRFHRDFKISSGTGPGTIDTLTFPTVAEVQQWRDSDIKPRLPVMMTVTVQGHLPAHAPTVSFRFPDVLGPIVLTTEFPYQEPVTEPLDSGTFSNPLPMPSTAPTQPPPPTPRPIRPPAAPRPPSPQTPTILRQPTPVPHQAGPVSSPTARTAATPPTALVAAAPNGVPAEKPVPPAPAPQGVSVIPGTPARPALIKAQPAPAQPPPLGLKTTTAPTSTVHTHTVPWIILVLRYVKMGFNHIVPEGLDHILFVLGLFLLSTRTKALLWQITAFTVAHSLTLALSLYGVLRLPPSIVEPVIAASIAFVAIENLFTTELKPWRPFVVFGFGLVHGMGFAGALKDLGLQRHDFLTALLGFNVGVELGQLSVVLLAMLAVGWYRKNPNYRKVVVLPGSVTIAVVALFWMMQRILIQV